MAGELQKLKQLVKGTDLERFADNEARLQFAVDYAVQKVNERRRFRGTVEEPYDPQYSLNVIQGALDYLETMGGSELQSFGENGVSGTRKDDPSWLAGIIPLAKVASR